MADEEPRLLIVETSVRVGQVAVARGAAVLAARRLDEARRHARDLAPAVADLLAQQGWRAAEVSAVIVSRGPGSYTGLRVGIMSAKTFAYATGCALVAVDTFAAIAHQAPLQAHDLHVLADAQLDKLYVQRFVRSDSDWQPASELAIEPAADWLARLSGAEWISGPGLGLVEGRLPSTCRRVSAGLREPRPESLLHLGLARYRAGQRDDPWLLEPLYLRPSSAEQQWERVP